MNKIDKYFITFIHFIHRHLVQIKVKYSHSKIYLAHIKLIIIILALPLVIANKATLSLN